MFLLTKRKEIMQPHRRGDLRQIKLWRYDVDERGRQRGGDVSQFKLLKSNCGDMMSTKREKKVATHLTEEVIFVGTAEGSSST